MDIYSAAALVPFVIGTVLLLLKKRHLPHYFMGTVFLILALQKFIAHNNISAGALLLTAGLFIIGITIYRQRKTPT